MFDAHPDRYQTAVTDAPPTRQVVDLAHAPNDEYKNTWRIRMFSAVTGTGTTQRTNGSELTDGEQGISWFSDG